MKMRVWTFIRDLGDGSCAVSIYNSREAAELAESQEEDLYGYVLEDCVDSTIINVEEYEKVEN